MVVAGAFCKEIGWADTLYSSDSTKLSVIISVVFLVSTVFSGYALFFGNKKSLQQTKRFNEFTGTSVLGLGMLGTLIGMSNMLGGFQNVVASDSGSVQQFISNLGTGVGVAIYTTISGLVASLLIGGQNYLVSKEARSL